MVTLLWALFGMSNRDGVELPSYPVNRIFGYNLYFFYNFLIVVLMLNMLIAMVSNTYTQIENDSESEFKFARTLLWLSYLENGSKIEFERLNRKL